MNGKDMIALMEYMNTFHKAPKTKRWPKKDPEFDIVEMLRKKQKEARFLEDFLKEQEKLNKKEDKKDEKKARAFTFAEGVILAYAAQFIIGPLYQHYVAALH